jgi:hypothetical protein
MINRHPRAYLSACVLAGLAIRAVIAHGDFGLWLNPLFPLVR